MFFPKIEEKTDSLRNHLEKDGRSPTKLRILKENIKKPKKKNDIIASNLEKLKK